MATELHIYFGHRVIWTALVPPRSSGRRIPVIDWGTNSSYSWKLGMAIER